ncbi:tetratricopeptide repeat protein [Flavobacterium sp. AG291]|uniref:tetratricopeptide repeat protein n=1 Tax=Flavobacterium sp. AG291 TaxID=2184000 RepID=UPI000E09F336|nr:tetratricopeptide repeat protein [Flavobacterium sp. AG291]RDI05808.1 tetratricopeptide repeat protein [Flavobacterium sp. AG291]
MHLLKNCKIVLLILFISLSAVSLNAHTVAQCDSLLKVGQQATRDKDYVKSLEVLATARSMAEKNRWKKQLFHAINYTGHNYIAMMDYGEALNYCLEAYNLAVKELDPEFEMIALNNIAILYTADKNYEKARDYYRKVYDAAKKEKFKSLGIYLINLANVENILENPVQARNYITEAMPNLKQYWPRSVVAAEMILAEADLLDGKTADAREEALQLLKNTKDVAYNDIAIPLNEIIVKSYFKEGRYDVAAQNALGILNKKPDLETRKRTFELLAEIYGKSNDFRNAVKFKDSVLSATEELNEVKNGRLFENSRVKFEMQEYKNQLALNQEKEVVTRRIIYSLLAFFIIALTATVFILRQKKLIAERNQRITALELEKEKNDNLLLEKQFRENETNALLEQERLKNEIETRNRKLSAKALYLSDRNQLIEDILVSLSKKTKLSKDTSLANQIKTLKSQLRIDNEWDDFITHFEELNQGFLNRLKTLHPTLTANDVRFVAYIYMNLSVKEISSILNITIEACRKRKERIAHKMELPVNVNIFDYISAL